MFMNNISTNDIPLKYDLLHEDKSNLYTIQIPVYPRSKEMTVIFK